MHPRMPLLTAVLATLSCLAAAGEAASAESLFERLGGTERVTAIVEATVDGLAANSRETSSGNALRRTSRTIWCAAFAQ